jgi:hypothetical protein
MRAKFIRGGDPKDSLEIGLPHKRFIIEAERALIEFSNEYGGEVIIDDPTWQGEGNVSATLSFLRGYKRNDTSLPLPSGYRYRLEYESRRENPMTVARNIGGGDWISYYIKDVNNGQEIIKGWIEDYMIKYFQNDPK